MPRPAALLSRSHPRSGRTVAAAGAGFILLATALPTAGPGTTTAGFCLVCGDVGGVDVVLNVLLYVPLGIGLGLARVRASRAAAVVLLFTLTIELLQLDVIRGRDASLGDIVMNTVGGLAGYGAAVARASWLRPPPPLAARLAIAAGAAWILVQAIGAYAFTPSLSDRPWFGQFRRDIAAYAPFERAVGPVELEGLPLPEHRFDAAPVRAALTSPPAMLRVALVPGPAPRRIAPIYRVADAARNEILMIGRLQDALVFRIRMGAADLRLRRPTLRLDGAFPAAPATPSSASASPGDSTVVRAHLWRGGVTLRADGAAARERRIRFSASWVWMLVLPFALLAPSMPVAIGTALWLGCALLPAGYWTGHAVLGTTRASLRAGLAGAGLLAAGLALVPAAVGLEPSTAAEWLWAALGFAAGYRVAARARSAAREPEHRLPLSLADRLHRQPASLPQ